MKNKKILITEEQLKLLLILNEEKAMMHEKINLGDFLQSARKKVSKFKQASFMKELLGQLDPKNLSFVGQFIEIVKDKDPKDIEKIMSSVLKSPVLKDETADDNSKKSKNFKLPGT